MSGVMLEISRDITKRFETGNLKGFTLYQVKLAKMLLNELRFSGKAYTIDKEVMQYYKKKGFEIEILKAGYLIKNRKGE